MPSLEMLKKLLDEFSEKEAHAREEINVITEQIGELEKRILTSQKKLSTVATDREKVKAMQARYSGGSTLTPGSPLTGAKTAGTSVDAHSVDAPTTAEEPKEEKQRARPGRGGAAAAAAAASASSDVGIPVAPLEGRGSSTRTPAMKLPETPTVAETSSSPFLSAPEQPAPAKAFSPMDIFGSAADEPEEQTAPESILYTEPAAAAPEYTGGVQYNAGASYEYQNAQPIDPVPSPNPPPIGEITTSFFTPMGATEATLQPPPQAVPQAEVAPQQSPFLSTASDPNQQPQAAQVDDSAQVQDLDEDEPDDTVKSINDALRGLFR